MALYCIEDVDFCTLYKLIMPKWLALSFAWCYWSLVFRFFAALAYWETIGLFVVVVFFKVYILFPGFGLKSGKQLRWGDKLIDVPPSREASFKSAKISCYGLPRCWCSFNYLVIRFNELLERSMLRNLVIFWRFWKVTRLLISGEVSS